MKWVLIIWLLFQVQYDLWADQSVTWQCIYFAVQYGTIAAIAFVEAMRGKHTLFYFVIFAITAFFSINELTWLSTTQIEFNQAHDGPTAYALGIVLIALFLILLENSTLWKRVKKSGG